MNLKKVFEYILKILGLLFLIILVGYLIFAFWYV